MCDEIKFNRNQEDVISYGEGTLLVEAGPGSGKTTVIVKRIEELIKKGVDPESFLVITFTTKAADNLKNKLREKLPNSIVLKMQISTIHSFCLEYLKSKNQSVTLIDDDVSEKLMLFIQKFKGDLGFVEESTIFDYHIPAILNRFGEYTCFKVDPNELVKKIKESREITSEYRNFIESQDYFLKKRIDDHDKPIKKDLKKDNPEYEERDLYSKSWYNARYLQIAKAYPKYLELLDKYDYVDYDTLQLKTLNELKNDSEIKFKTIFVDEFQDTDPLQFRIFEILRKNCNYFTAVGDVDQHIYAFRSSFNDFFDELIRLDNPDVLSLDVNYRSTENIVKLTEDFIQCQRKNTSNKNMRSNDKNYNNPNFLIENKDSKEEADKIYEIIKILKCENLIQDYSDVAILYRKHSDETIANLIEKFNSDDDIDFSIVGQSDLASQDEVKSVITLLWYISRKTDLGYVPSKAELNELNLKAFCGEYFEPSFWSLDDSTKCYLNELVDSFNRNVVEIENEFRKINGDSTVRAAHRVKDNENQDTLIEIFKKVQMPIIDLEKIENKKDKEFFRFMDGLRDKIHSEEPPTILEVFYDLIALGDLFSDVENNYKEIANLAILTQTISNYESFISETDVRGLLFFLNNVIEKYDSYQENGKGVQLMTIHAAKGLEFPVTIITSLEKDKFPMTTKDPKRELDYVWPNDTYYTPNECLKYKTILKEEDGELVHKTISIEEENKLNDEEEDRVLYVAMTRAADLLILSAIGETPEQIERIRDQTSKFNFDDLKDVKIEEHYDAQDEEKLVLNYSKYTQYLSCPFKYDLGYNLGFVRPGRKAANRGTAFHNIMEEVNGELKEYHEVDTDELIEKTHKYYQSMLNIEENPEDYEEFKNNVIGYYETYSKTREVLEAEYDFEIDRGDYIFNGSIDLIYKTDNDEIVVLDYKYAEYDEEHIDGYTKQLHLYAAALKSIPEYKDYKIKKAITHFVLGDGENGDYQHVVDITDEKINKELEGLDKVAKKINCGLKNLDKNMNKCFPKNYDKCDNCSYRTFCVGKK